MFSILQLTTLDDLADSITKKGLSTLRDVLIHQLKNVTLRREVLGLADQIQNISLQVRTDISSIKHRVEDASLDKVIDVVGKAEFYRYSYTRFWVVGCSISKAIHYIMSLCMRKPTICGSDQVRHKLGCTVTEDC